MGRRKKEVIETVAEKPTGWVDGAMPEPVSVLPTAPDPKPTQKVSRKATAEKKAPDPKKVEKKKADTGCYDAVKYKGFSLLEALRIAKIDGSFINRKRIAEANGIDNYLGLGKDNKEMLGLLVAGKLKKPLV